ncbi:MFS transporter [Kurthia gibsonii]|uniref:MDR family MFS transporter n=1 Tax=Kurthia gibsonii TaxID=33946 RepID=UPI003F2058CF
MKIIQYFHPVVWHILLGTIFTRIASFMTIPFLALYLHSELHAKPVTIGIIIGLAPLLATVGGFFGGYLTDRFGRKLIILLAVFCWTLVFLGFALSTSIVVFGFLSALNGLCRSFFEPATQALMVDYTTPEKRRRLFSVRYTAINIAAVIGPLVGVWLAALSNPQIPFIITAIMYALYGLALVFILKKYATQAVIKATKSITAVFQVVFTDRKLLLLLVGGILVSVGYSQFDSTLPQFVNATLDDGVKLYSVLIAVNAIAVLILQLPLSVISERISTIRTLILGIVFFAIGFVLFDISESWTMFIIAMILFTIGEIFAFPMMNAVIEEIAPEDRKATYLGASQLKNIGSFVGPILGGWLLIQFQMGVFHIIAVITLCSIPFFYWTFAKKEA